MSSQRQMGDSPALTSIEVQGTPESEDYGQSVEWEEAMNELMAEPMHDPRRFEVSPSPELGDGQWNSAPEDERETSGSPGGGGIAAARFRGVSRGPLGAEGIVNNKQILLAQLREAEGLLQSIQADDEQSFMADEDNEWADAALDKLTRHKAALRKHAERLTEETEAIDDTVEGLTAKLATLPDAEPHKLISLCDNLPPDMGPALLRLVKFYFQDDDSIDGLPQKYKDLISQDVHLLAQKALPPSQDVTVLRRELASARADVEANGRDVTRLEGTISELQSDQVRRASVQDKLETKLSNLKTRYNAGSVRLGDRIREEEKKNFQYKRWLEKSNEKCKGLNTLLVKGEEEKERLMDAVEVAQSSVEQRDATIKQLDEHIMTVEAVEEGLCVTMQLIQARFNKLRARHESLQVKDKSLLDRIEGLRSTIAENDLNRNRLEQRLRNDVSTKSRECDDFRVEIERLKREAQKAERVISNAQLQLENHAQVSAELAVHREQVSLLEEEKGDIQKMLDASEGERRRVQERLDAASAGINLLRAIGQGDNIRIGTLREEKTRDQEKIRGLEGNLRDANSQLTGRAAAVSRLEERLRSKEGEVTKLLADVARLGTNEEEHKKSIALEQAKAQKLQTQVSATETSLATKEQRVVELQDQVTRLLADIARLGKTEQEHKKSISLEQDKGQRLQTRVSIADTSLDIAQRRVTSLNREKAELTAKLESQKTRAEEQTRKADDSRKEVQRLGVTVDELKRSLELLQNEKVKSARDLGALQESLKRESSDRLKLQQDSEATKSGLSQLREQYQLLKAEGEAQKDEANKRASDVARLTTESSSLKSSLVLAEGRAKSSVQELQSFLSRLCLAPARDPAVFEGLACQLQVPGMLEAQGPAATAGWVILEAWDDEAVGETIHLPEGLEMLVLELYRTAVVGIVGTRKCRQALQRAMEAVCAGTVIHAGVFSEMARVFVQAIAAQPDEGFEAGLVLWQLLDVVQQRWGPPHLDGVKDDLAVSLRAHEYSDVFEVVARRGQFRQSDDCHFFSDTSAVFARENHPRAVLIDAEDQSIRFFSKMRWTRGVSGCTIEPLDGHPKVFLQSKNVHDFVWAQRMF